ncbi:MAG: hypothetical protein ABIO55_01855 [Ginsengibacter sp.]
MTDFLSLFVSNEKAFSFIRKTFRVTFVLFLVNALYGMFELWEWYSFVQDIPVATKDSPPGGFIKEDCYILQAMAVKTIMDYTEGLYFIVFTCQGG